jgi:serine/threonine-protein kinase
MDRTGHIQIGMAALARGYIDLRAFADAMIELGRRGDAADPEDIWMGRGKLGIPEIRDLASKGPGAATAALAGGPARATLAPAAPPRGGQGGEDGQVEAHAPAPALLTIRTGDAAPPSSRRGSLDSELERYTIVGVLGSGGMGDVLKCQDATLRRPVAMKALRPELSTDSTAALMLHREAQLTGSLEHPSIIPIYDAGVRPDIGAYYVMRLVEQPSLADVLARLRAGDPAVTHEFTQGRLLRSFVQVCRAVDYAHSRGVIHCDIKPANILLGSFGEVLVVDWGLAYVNQSPHTYRGGTLGFMAPEQLGASGKVDARTDVFALGAVLYEIACGEQAFSDASLGAMLKTPSGRSAGRPIPQPPTERAPDRCIPDELSAICMRALSTDPAARYPTASDLASAIEAFLEGTREQERRRERAERLIEEGDRLSDAYYDLLSARPERIEELRSIRSALAPWESTERKRKLWDAEDRLLALDHICMRTLQSAISAYEQALHQVPGHADARHALGRLYLAELERAEVRGDEFDRAYFDNLVRQHDEDLLSKAQRNDGVLRVTAEPDGEVTLIALEEIDRRLVPARERSLGRTPIEGVPVAPGHYVVQLRLPSLREVKQPILVRAGREVALAIDARGALDLDPGEIFVPAGPALLGGDEATLDGGEPRLVDVPAFIIEERHVSFAEYLEFVGELFQTNRKLASKCVPCSANGFAFWRWDGQRFTPAASDLWGYQEESLMRLPAFGVNVRSAQAFAAWKSRRMSHLKRTYRLPTDEEWEKAARGTDGRRYPWGDHFDASFCKMRESRPGLPRPEQSGACSADVSPYGVLDMAGGMADWVVSTTREPESEDAVEHVASRGGAWCDWHLDCRLSARRPHLSVERTPRVGFRLVRTP